LPSAVQDASADNVIYVKINGIALNYDASNGWQLTTGTSVAIRIPYATDAVDVIEIKYSRAF
jgi:hypothetical protein